MRILRYFLTTLCVLIVLIKIPSTKSPINNITKRFQSCNSDSIGRIVFTQYNIKANSPPATIELTNPCLIAL